MRNVQRTVATQWAFGIAAWSALLSLSLFAFVYWQTAAFMHGELVDAVGHKLKYAAADPAASAIRVEAWLGEDLHSVHFAGLFDQAGAKLSGNLDGPPAGLPLDGKVHRIGTQVSLAGRRLNEDLWSAGLRLADGRILVIAHDTDEIDRAKATIVRALGLAIMPMLLLSGLGGLLLGARARRRVAATQSAVARVMQGDLNQRLPVQGTNDEFDRLAHDVNAMLAEIQRLMEEVRGVGDAIAHDLRTPLTRLRARLERSRDTSSSVEELKETIDQSLLWLDQTLSLITAVLRIGEIEHGQRCAAFTRLDLGHILSEVGEFYEPIADEKGIALSVTIDGPGLPLDGDRDLFFEALANLVDNAVKFTPEGGAVRLSLSGNADSLVITIEDTGPGIPLNERNRVFQRFYRSAPARPTTGNGLGLGLVAAIAHLHRFEVAIGEGPEGGCRVEIIFPPATAVPLAP